MKKYLLITLTYLSSFIQAQETKQIVPSSSPLSIIKFSDEERKSKPSLQDFVENIYVNSIAVFEDGKSTYSTGEFPVYVLSRKLNMYRLIETKDLNQYNINQIKNFKYLKNEEQVALFGSKIQAIGLVFLEIED